MAKQIRYTAEWHAKAVEIFEDRGMYADVAKAMNVGVSTLREWRKKHPQLEADFDAAYERLCSRIARKYVRAIEKHVDDVLAGKRLPDRYGIVQKEGKRILIQRGEPIRLDVALAKMALTRAQPKWITTPRDETDKSLAAAVVEKLLTDATSAAVKNTDAQPRRQFGVAA